MWNLATKRKIQTLKGNKNTFMPDIGDLLTYRHASWIQWLTDKQLICKKNHCSENYCNCIVIWDWWWCQFDMIIHVSISAKKTELGSFVSASTFSLMAEQDGFSVPWNGWKFSLTHFPTIYRSDLGICPNRWREKDKICKFWPQPKIGDLLTSDDLLVWFNYIIWYVVFRGLQNTHFEW